MTNLCRTPGTSKGFTYFFVSLYFHVKMLWDAFAPLFLMFKFTLSRPEIAQCPPKIEATLHPSMFLCICNTFSGRCFLKTSIPSVWQKTETFAYSKFVGAKMVEHFKFVLISQKYRLLAFIWHAPMNFTCWWSLVLIDGTYHLSWKAHISLPQYCIQKINVQSKS